MTLLYDSLQSLWGRNLLKYEINYLCKSIRKMNYLSYGLATLISVI